VKFGIFLGWMAVFSQFSAGSGNSGPGERPFFGSGTTSSVSAADGSGRQIWRNFAPRDGSVPRYRFGQSAAEIALCS
jgi:hypothetical protein